MAHDLEWILKLFHSCVLDSGLRRLADRPIGCSGLPLAKPSVFTLSGSCACARLP